MIIQVNGKVRSQFEAVVGISESEAKNKAISDIKAQKYIDKKEIKRVIFVPNKLINIVVGDWKCKIAWLVSVIMIKH